MGFITLRPAGVLIADVHKGPPALHFPVGSMDELGSVDFSDPMAFLSLERAVCDVLHCSSSRGFERCPQPQVERSGFRCSATFTDSPAPMVRMMSPGFAVVLRCFAASKKSLKFFVSTVFRILMASPSSSALTRPVSGSLAA